MPQFEVVSILRKVASFWSDAEAERKANYKLKRKAELERLPTLLAADERPIVVADCSRAGRYLGAATTDTKGLLVVTDKRILFLSNRGKSVERVGFDEVASVSARVGVTGGEVQLVLRRGKSRKFNFVEPKSRATEMGDFIANHL